MHSHLLNEEGQNVSAAIEHDATLAVGDSVFVHPHELVPDHLRGLQGIVVALEGVEAQLRQSPSDEPLRVEVGFLRRDRRRPRVPADWEIAS
jgi:hypothetical protein